MTTEVKKLDDSEEVAVNEVDETKLLDVLSAAVDEVTPDDVLAANKEINETEDGSEGAGEQTGEEKAAKEKAAEEKAAEEKAAAEAFEKLTPEEKTAAEEKAAEEKTAAEEKAAEEKAVEEKAAAEAFEKLTPEEKTAAEEKAVEEKAAADAAAKVDPINDPIPESTKAETATRIKSLIQITKDSTLRGEQGDEIVARITDTGADPEQYANTLGFLKLYNSTDPVQRKAALAAAEGVVRELRIELGEGSVDLLDKYDDLKAEVEADKLTEARAIEIATSREQVLLATARATAATNKSVTDQQILDNNATGKAQLTTLENTLRVSDPEYARLRDTFITMLRPALRKAHATDWGEVAQGIYTAVKLANPVAANVEKLVPKNTPLRPKGSGGAGSADHDAPPASALDAVNAALGDL